MTSLKILDPDYYENELLKLVKDDRGLFGLPFAPIADENTAKAFMSGIEKDHYTLVDVVPAPGGQQLYKIYKLTAAGRIRKATLAMKFAPAPGKEQLS